MTNRDKLVSRSQHKTMGRSDSSERQDRILDAAAELIAHYGYDKTTVEDIARAAGVSKGAIYLHFGSKDELFEWLLQREMRTFAESWLEGVEADPRGGTIAGLYKGMLYALSRHRFMAAILRQDRQLLGSYLRKPNRLKSQIEQGSAPSPRYAFVRAMQEAGAVRRDLDPKVIAHIMNMLAFGLFAMEGLVPPEEVPPIEDLIEGIAELMERALVPEGGASSEVGKAIVRQIAEAARQQERTSSSASAQQKRLA